MRVSSGLPSRLGATFDGKGTNFALFSANAERVVLCLFDKDGRETNRIELPEKTGDVWHGHVANIGVGQLYGYRVHGPFAPERGHRFNANKLLLDPCAKAMSGRLVLNELHFGHRYGDPTGDLSFDTRDDADAMVKGVVVSPVAPQPAKHPHIAWEDSIIYEAHVRGLTQLREDVPPAWRGTFRGLSSPAIIAHLKALGATAIELLPVHAFIDDWFVRERGLHNYWGYNTIGFFMPDARYVGADNPEIFRETVDRLHDAGIEVILDVVYNHSCEGDELGPTLMFRGIDNASYYRLVPDQPRYYDNATGCGNTLNMAHPAVRQLALESLRFWAEHFHVDGFRFDLAASLGRGTNGFEPDAPLFAAIKDDPALRHMKLIAEPWDVGPGGYQAGNFPRAWSEWNDRFRRSLRQFWLREGLRTGDIARRMTASDDVFDRGARAPRSCINYVTAHDGFTLADLVSFEHKHNEQNLEGNHDGENQNDSTNCGVEGGTNDAWINAQRLRLKKTLLASLMLAHGVPMLLAGDEAGNSQNGNNNAYGQDNAIGWIDWRGLGGNGDLTGFIGRLSELRRQYPQLRAHRWLDGEFDDGTFDVRWFASSGGAMTPQDWDVQDGKFLSYLLASPPEGAALYIVLNAAVQTTTFKLPAAPDIEHWSLCLDTSSSVPNAVYPSGLALDAPAQSVLVLAAAN